MDVEIQVQTDTPPAGISAHLLPCCISHNGPASVSSYFLVDTTSSAGGETVHRAKFRGRQLCGVTVPAPQGYSGFVFREDKPALTDGEERKIALVGTFDSFTLWSLETAPTPNDVVLKALHMAELANVIHGED